MRSPLYGSSTTRATSTRYARTGDEVCAQKHGANHGQTFSLYTHFVFSCLTQANVRNYYMQFEEHTTQSLMETKLRAFDGGAAAAYQMQVSQVLQQQMRGIAGGVGHPGGAKRRKPLFYSMHFPVLSIDAALNLRIPPSRSNSVQPGSPGYASWSTRRASWS